MLKINSFFFCTLLFLFVDKILETDGNAMNSLSTQYVTSKYSRVKHWQPYAVHSKNVRDLGMKYVREHLSRKGRLAHHGHHNHNKIIFRLWNPDGTTTNKPVIIRRLKKKDPRAHQLDWNKRHIALETFAKRLNATSANGTETTDRLANFIPIEEIVEPKSVAASTHTTRIRTTSTTGTNSITTTTPATSVTSTPTTTTSTAITTHSTITPTLTVTVTVPTTETQTTTQTTIYPTTLSADELDPTLPNYLSFYSEVPIYNFETIPYYLPPDYTTMPNLEIMLKRNGHGRPHRNMPLMPVNAVQATLAVQKPQTVKVVQVTQAPTTVRIIQTVQTVKKIPPAAVRIPQSIQPIPAVPAVPAVPVAPQVPMAPSVAILPSVPNIPNVPAVQGIHESQWNQMVQAAEVTQAARGAAAAVAKSAVSSPFTFPTFEDTFEQEQGTTDAFATEGNLLDFPSTVRDLAPRTILTKIFVIPIVEEAQMLHNFDLESALKSANFVLDKDMKRSEPKARLPFTGTTLKSSTASVSQRTEESTTQKITTTIKRTTPIKTTPIKTEAPVKTTTSIKTTTPIKTVTPVKITTIKITTPTPIKTETPIKITTFGTTGRNEKRNKKSSSNKHNSNKKNATKHKNILRKGKVASKKKKTWSNKHKVSSTRKKTTHRTEIKKRSTTERHQNSKHKKHHREEIHEEYQILM